MEKISEPFFQTRVFYACRKRWEAALPLPVPVVHAQFSLRRKHSTPEETYRTVLHNGKLRLEPWNRQALCANKSSLSKNRKGAKRYV